VTPDDHSAAALQGRHLLAPTVTPAATAAAMLVLHQSWLHWSSHIRGVRAANYCLWLLLSKLLL
jgi:hypothetical protein